MEVSSSFFMEPIPGRIKESEEKVFSSSLGVNELNEERSSLFARVISASDVSRHSKATQLDNAVQQGP